MDRHLVAVVVGIEADGHVRVEADGDIVGENRPESQHAVLVERWRPDEEDHLVLDHGL